jgi:glycosyltransferase involved in cell wall biosynthesis
VADVLTFTIVVPAYNAADTIGRAVESALAQTITPLEVLVVDDGSRDETAAVVERYGAPVRVIRQENGGTASARNRGIEEAVGDVVCFLDSDDRYEPGRLETIAAKLGADPALDGVMTDAALVTPEGITRASSWWPAAASRDRLDLRAKIIFCALALRRSVLRELGSFDPRFHLLEDVEMWHRLICRGYAIGYVDEPSYLYLINPVGKTQSADRVKGEWELFRIQLRYAVARRTPNAWRARLAFRAARAFRNSSMARIGR